MIYGLLKMDLKQKGYGFIELKLESWIWCCDHDHKFWTIFLIMLAKIGEVYGSCKKHVIYHDHAHITPKLGHW